MGERCQQGVCPAASGRTSVEQSSLESGKIRATGMQRATAQAEAAGGRASSEFDRVLSANLKECSVHPSQRDLYGKVAVLKVPPGARVEFSYSRNLPDGGRAVGSLGFDRETIALNHGAVGQIRRQSAGNETQYVIGLYKGFTGTLTVKVGDQVHTLHGGAEQRAEPAPGRLPPARNAGPEKPAPESRHGESAAQKDPSRPRTSPSSQGKAPSVAPGSGPAAEDLARARALLAKAEAAKARGDELLAMGEAERRRYGGGSPGYYQQCNPTVFNRFYQDFLRNVPCRVPGCEGIIRRLGLPRTEIGTIQIDAPKDPNRPGVIVSADQAAAKDLEDVTVKALREATTKVLLTSDDEKITAYADAHPNYMREVRATTRVVLKPGDMLQDGIDTANAKLSAIPAAAAALGTQDAIDAAAQRGLFPRRARRLASVRAAQAACGGRGSGEFEAGLASGRARAQVQGAQAVAAATELIVQRALEVAYRHGAQANEAAVKVWKDTNLMGCEVDFSNRRKTGVDYFVPTREGQTYYLRDLGKNYGDPAGACVPVEVYGKFNVDILLAYMNGKEAAEKAQPGSGAAYRLSVKELEAIANQSNIYLGQKGEMHYRAPGRGAAGREQ